MAIFTGLMSKRVGACGALLTAALLLPAPARGQLAAGLDPATMERLVEEGKVTERRVLIDEVTAALRTIVGDASGRPAEPAV